MAYCTATQIKAMLSESIYNRGLKDGETGDADSMFAQVVDLASDDVDSILEAGFTVPLASPYPKVVQRAARLFACDIICKRRGVPDADNPCAEQAKDVRDVLQDIVERRRPLSLAAGSSAGSGTAMANDDLLFDDTDDED